MTVQYHHHQPDKGIFVSPEMLHLLMTCCKFLLDSWHHHLFIHFSDGSIDLLEHPG